MNVLRSILAVFSGYIAMAAIVVTGTLLATVLVASEAGPTPAYLGVNFLVSFVAAVAGASLTMRMAPFRPRLHVGALGAGMILITLPALTAAPGQGAPEQPGWYTLAILLLGLTGLVVGAWLTERSVGAEGTPAPEAGPGGAR